MQSPLYKQLNYSQLQRGDSPDFASFVVLLSSPEHLRLLHQKQSGPERLVTKQSK